MFLWWMFLWWIVKDFCVANKSYNCLYKLYEVSAHVDISFCYLPLIWNIYMNRPYPNWDSLKVFERILFCLRLIKHAFLHKEDTYLLKFRFLSIFTPSNICLLLSEIFFIFYTSPNIFILYSERSKWQDLGFILCYFQFIQWP